MPKIVLLRSGVVELHEANGLGLTVLLTARTGSLRQSHTLRDALCAASLLVLSSYAAQRARPNGTLNYANKFAPSRAHMLRYALNPCGLALRYINTVLYSAIARIPARVGATTGTQAYFQSEPPL